VAIANQHFVREIPDRKDSSPHELITNGASRGVDLHGGRLADEANRGAEAGGPTHLDGKLYEE
jgi:hypothetical protein